MGSLEQKVTVTSLAQFGCKCPVHGENVTSGGGDHVKRTGSEGEWFVKVNDSCLDAPTAQSPNLTWFSLDAAGCKSKRVRIVLLSSWNDLTNS